MNLADEALQKLGGKFISVNYTMSRYDLIVVSEAPDDETVVAFLVQVAGQGNIRSETMKSFSSDEMAAILGKAPG